MADKQGQGRVLCVNVLLWPHSAVVWYYEGALVLGRNRGLSNAAYANIASAFQQAVGLDASKFCIPQALPLTALIDENLYAQWIVEQFSVVVDMSIIP